MPNASPLSRIVLLPALAGLVLAGAVLGGCPAEQPRSRQRREPPPEFRKRQVRYAPGERPPAPEPEPPEPPESASASAPASAPGAAAEPGLDPDQYSNPIAGFRVRKPKGWHFLTPEQVRDAQEEAWPDNEALKALLKAATPPPMVAFAKHKEPYAALNPNVRVTYRPDPFPEKPLTRLLDEVIATAKGFSKDARITGKPAALRIAGHEAAQARLQHTLRTPSVTAGVESRLVVVRKGRGFYTIGLTGLPTGADRCEAEFAAVVASIQLD
jgi:hypothetical protein